MTMIALGSIRTDGGTQPRAGIDAATVDRYAEAIHAGDVLPPIDVFHDGTDYWLANGFHRLAASRQASCVDITAHVRAGTREDALVFSWGANVEHDKGGLPRTNADKRRAVESALRFYAGKGVRKSDGEIAEACKVHPKYVADVRRQLGVDSKLDLPTKVTGKDGRTRETANTGKRAAKTEPAAPLAAAMAPTALLPKANLFATAQIDDDIDDDLDAPIDESELEVIEGEEPPVIARESESRAWGSFDVSSKVARIVGIAREFQEKLTLEWEGVDPRFEGEIRTRTQDALLSVTDAVLKRLPPNGAQAVENRRGFVVLPGGK